MACGTGELNIDDEVSTEVSKDQGNKANPDCISANITFQETVVEATPYT